MNSRSSRRSTTPVSSPVLDYKEHENGSGSCSSVTSTRTPSGSTSILATNATS